MVMSSSEAIMGRMTALRSRIDALELCTPLVEVMSTTMVAIASQVADSKESLGRLSDEVLACTSTLKQHEALFSDLVNTSTRLPVPHMPAAMGPAHGTPCKFFRQGKCRTGGRRYLYCG